MLSYYLRLSDSLTLSTLNPIFSCILKSRRKFIQKYKLFNGALENRIWLKNLKKHSYDLHIKLKKNFDEPLLHLRLKAIFPTVLSMVNIFSVFDHMFYCARSCDKVNVFCRYCSVVNVVKPDYIRIFQDIAIDERNFTKEFLSFFARRSVFTLNLFDSHSFWISKKQCCLKFEQQKKTQQHFIYF